MDLIEKELFVCVDCEATGLDPENDRLIEVAYIRFTFSQILEQFESLVDPLVTIPERSIAIHHITQDMVQGKPQAGVVLPQVIQALQGAIIIGHGVAYDLELISNEAKRASIPCDLRALPFIDTLRLARLYGESRVNSLEKLRQHFNIAAEGAHRALSDVIVNMEVFKQLAKRYKSSKQIFEALSKPILMKSMPLGKHKGRLLKEIPLEYLQWAVHKDFDEDLLYSLKVELKRRRKGGDFTQMSNPFQAL